MRSSQLDRALVTNYMKFVAKEPAFWHKNAVIPGERKNALYRDRFMQLFVNNDVKINIEKSYKKKSFFAVAARHHYFNRILLKNIKLDFIKQIIILGAGYDTRAVNFNNILSDRMIRVFEVDQPSILTYKEAIYNKNLIDKNAVYLTINYLCSNLISYFKSHGIDIKLPTYFLWEGNTMYLDKEEMDGILQMLRGNFQKFLISFDYVSNSFLNKQVCNDISKEDYENFKSKGSPWKNGYDDIQSIAEKYDLILLENIRNSDLQKRLQIEKQPDPLSNHYFQCTMQTPC